MHMQTNQAQYKSNYDRQVRKVPTFQVGSYIFVNKPSLRTTSRSSASALVSSAYNKLQEWTVRLYRILEKWDSSVTIDEYSILNTISFDLIAHAPTSQSKYGCDEALHKAKETCDIQSHKA